jgi:predicted GTPase
MIYRTKRLEVPIPEIGAREHWTPHDQQAFEIIESEQKRLDGVTGDELTDIRFFRVRTVELATKLALHYHPKAKDPLDKLSIVEILTIAELVAEDLEGWFQTYVPGSHLITVGQWKMLAHAPGWWKTATNVGWIAAVASNPLIGLGRYAVSKVVVDPVTKQLQAGILGTFFTLYLRQVGKYLVELNSGRLRGGAAAYRKAMRKLEPSPTASGKGVAPDVAPAEPLTVTIAVIGQVKAGKSSLVNCLMNDQRAAVDVLPLTRNVDRYELKLEESRDRLVLLDTPGYSDAGATPAQIEATREAVRQADLILLVMAATSPAKQADVAMLTELKSWFRSQNRLKPPPIIGVVSKIDGLRPVMEWSPPYDWEQPSRPKEQSIHDAVEFARQSMGSSLPQVVPVCTDREHRMVYGIEEWLLPLLIVQLDEARAVSLVRSIHRDYDGQKVLKVLSQFAEVGRRIKDAVRNSLQG